MQILYQNNLPLLKQIINQYLMYEDKEDLFQEAYFGLWEAVKHYDATKETTFMSYARYWIKQAVLRYIENCGSIIRIPSYTRQKIIRYKKTIERLSQEYGRIPTDKEVAEKMCIGMSELDCIKAHSQSVLSLDAPLNDDEEETVCNTIQDDFNLEDVTIDKIYNECSKNELWGIVKRYTSEIENEIICSRFISKETLQTIADKQGLSRDRIRQIEASAIHKLRHGKAKRELKDSFDYINGSAYRNGVRKYKEHNFTSTVEYIAMNRVRLREKDADIFCKNASNL